MTKLHTTDHAAERARHFLGQQLPNADDAERSLLSCCLQNAEALATTRSMIEGAGAFGRPAHAALWDSINAIGDRGGEPHLTAVEAHLQGRGVLESIGGIDYLIDVYETETRPTADAAKSLAEAVVAMHVKRRVVELGQRLIVEGHESRDDITAMIERLQGDALAIGQGVKHAGGPAAVCSLADLDNTLAEPVVDGLLRRGETMNMIAAPKVGKSWLAYDLLISIATGRRWLNTFDTTPGRVLLIDNELHPQTIGYRLPKVAAAMGLDTPDGIDVLSLRGKGITLDKLGPYLGRIESGQYQVIVLDAWYRFIPPGMSENSNADVMGLYNLLDRYAHQTGAAFVAVHHSSKGSQGDKAITDVGAGAGSQSRAADAHVVLRQHEDDGCVVLEAAVRSFAPVDPVGLRWDYPVWRLADDLDTGALKDRKSKLEQRHAEADAEGIHKIIEALKAGPLTTNKVCLHAGGMGYARGKRLLGRMLDAGTVKYESIKVRGQDAEEWSLAE